MRRLRLVELQFDREEIDNATAIVRLGHAYIRHVRPSTEFGDEGTT
jgi:hypothetical protein